MQITVTVNGTGYTREVEARLLLIHFLRDELRLNEVPFAGSPTSQVDHIPDETRGGMEIGNEVACAATVVERLPSASVPAAGS